MSQSFKMPDGALFVQLWEQQEGRCAVCKKTMLRNRFEAPHSRIWARQRASLDHKWPRSKGGRDTPDNLQLTHAQCNKRKGDKVP